MVHTSSIEVSAGN